MLAACLHDANYNTLRRLHSPEVWQILQQNGRHLHIMRREWTHRYAGKVVTLIGIIIECGIMCLYYCYLIDVSAGKKGLQVDERCAM